MHWFSLLLSLFFKKKLFNELGWTWKYQVSTRNEKSTFWISVGKKKDMKAPICQVNRINNVMDQPSFAV
jgi:hypothetical protein